MKKYIFILFCILFLSFVSSSESRMLMLPLAANSGNCIISENPESTCDDGLDNDCDGDVDGDDSDCGGETEVASITFDSISGNLGDDGNWTTEGGNFACETTFDTCYPNNSYDYSSVRYTGAGSFNSDQYSEVTIYINTARADSEYGAAARMQTGAETYYHIHYEENVTTLWIGYCVAATCDNIQEDTGKSYSNGDKIRIEVSGSSTSTRLTAKEDTGGGWSTIWSNQDPGADHYIDNGVPGVSGWGNNFSGGYSCISAWAGGNL